MRCPLRDRVWVFDLDNTLHAASPHIFPHINRSMTAYVAAQLEVEEAEANRLRNLYWRRYGATLLGLMRHHGTDPGHFLWHTHQFPDLPGMLVFPRAVRSMLRRLPGRKIVFSNGPQHYAEAVLDAMGVSLHFDGIFTIEHTGFAPKPGIIGFHRFLREHKLTPQRCVMVEDSPENLRTAKRVGMQTVLVSPHMKRPAFVDVTIQSILDLPHVIGKI